MATDIWQDLGQPDDVGPAFICNRISSSGYIGRIDNLLATCHYIDSGNCITPQLNAAEMAIYNRQYLYDYYLNKANKIMGGDGVNWVELVEGDSKVRRSDITTVSRLYKETAKEVKEDLNGLANLYRQNLSTARSVDYYTIDQYVANYPFNVPYSPYRT